MDRPIISSDLKIAQAKAEDLPCLLVQRVMRFKMANEQMTDWLFFSLNTPQFIEHLSHGLTGSDLPHFTGTGVAEYVIPLPTLPEQDEIVCRVNELFALAEARYKKAKAHFDRMPAAILAIRGELVPQAPTDESAEVLLERLRAAKAEPKTTKSRGSKLPKVKTEHAKQGTLF